MARLSNQELSEKYIRLAKRANVRLKALEDKTDLEDNEKYLNYAYAYAMKAINNVRGEGFTRWKQGTKGMTRRQIMNALDDVEYFLSEKTSMLSGFNSANAKRAYALSHNIHNKTGFVKGSFTEDDVEKFFLTGGAYDRLMTRFGYRESLKYGSMVFEQIRERGLKYTYKTMKEVADTITFSRSPAVDEKFRNMFKRALSRRPK